MKKIFPLLVIMTFVSCSTSNKEIKINQSYKVGETIPPGSAVIEGKLTSFVTNDDSFILNIAVDKISGYGQATKPIAPNSNLKIELQKGLLNVSEEKDFLEVGNQLGLLINQPKPDFENKIPDEWMAKTIWKLN